MKTLNTLDAWNVDAEDFPTDAGSDEKLWFMLKYAVLAPSSHNTQPWRFRITGPEVELYADLTRSLPIVDPHHRELFISCGAALFHLQVAMRYFGYASQVELFPRREAPTLLARIQLGLKHDTETEDILLFNAIPKRRTNRFPFQPDPVPEALLALLQSAAAAEGAWLRVVQAEDTRFALADLVAEADRVQWSNRYFRQELAEWIHPSRTERSDGIPGYAQGVGNFLDYAGPFVIRTFDVGRGRAAKDRDIALHSPVLAILGTESDTPRDWLKAGQALDRVLLRARVEDVWASFLNQAMEVDPIRAKVQSALAQPGVPQLVLRLGFGPDVKPTPRRRVEELLVAGNLRSK
ncbi:MAG: nitroreductase [Verrucomicrobia bacterium]|nr:nitroreductase [Verrucomicrobiota bacterium]